MSPRRLGWGLAAAGTYVLLALLVRETTPFGPVPLYDGLAPPVPYRWVTPPPDLASGNVPPLAGKRGAKLTAHGSEPLSAFTPDAQAQMTFPGGVFPPAEEDRSVRVEIRPLDPRMLGPPPRGIRFAGNAYEFVARYHPSRETAELSEPAFVALRYPVHATILLQRSGDRWVRLPVEQVVASSLTIVGRVERLGLIVAARPPGQPRGFPWRALAILSAGAAVLAAGLGWLARRRAASRTGGG